jgi:probable selenium-dependent hydroxylase accessory protein YqeC
MQIAPLLHIGRGVTALLGGGGKTTLMETLSRELGRRGRVIFGTTTKILPPSEFPVLLDPVEEEVCAALTQHRIICVGSTAPEGKLTVPALPFARLAALCDYVLVEADGAHRLPLKAHAAHEPVIPDGTQRSVLVLGADGFGKPIRETCHRPGLYASLAGVSPDEIVTPQLAARVIRAEGWGDRVLVNKVESQETYLAAQELSKELTLPVVAGSLHKGVYTCLF